jgi:hypothetical protein
VTHWQLHSISLPPFAAVAHWRGDHILLAQTLLCTSGKRCLWHCRVIRTCYKIQCGRVSCYRCELHDTADCCAAIMTSAARCALLLHPHFTNAVSLCITFVVRGTVPTHILRLRRAPLWESWPPHLALCSRIKSRQPRDLIWMVCGRLNDLLCDPGVDLAEGISTGCTLTHLTVCGSMDTDEQHLP